MKFNGRRRHAEPKRGKNGSVGIYGELCMLSRAYRGDAHDTCIAQYERRSRVCDTARLKCTQLLCQMHGKVSARDLAVGGNGKLYILAAQTLAGIFVYAAAEFIHPSAFDGKPRRQLVTAIAGEDIRA